MAGNGRIFVTGATGFLGSNLVRRLADKGDDITILVRKGSDHPFLKGLRIERVQGDITDYESVLEGMKGCHYVYHCAGLVSYKKSDARRMYDVNVGGTENVCSAALKNDMQRVLIVSSTAAVGIPEDPGKPADENHLFHRKWRKLAYMQTKRLAELRTLKYTDKGLDVVSANPSTFYGAGDIKMVSGEVFRQIASGRLKAAPPGGNGIIAVSDCVEGIIAVMQRGRKGERYILNSENLTFLEIFNTITNALGKPAIVRTIPRRLYIPALLAAVTVETTGRIFGFKPSLSTEVVKISWRYRYFDSSKVKKELDWTPQKSFKEACTEAVDFYRRMGVID